MNKTIKIIYFLYKTITYISIYKIFNLILSYFLYYFKNSKNASLPFSISIEPTTSCNLRCPQCVSGLRSFTRPTGMIEIQNFKKIINQIKSHTLNLNLYFQGEPFLNTDFFEMIKYANTNKIFVSTSTNAHYLNVENAEKTVKSGLSKLIISMDGSTQENYEKYRIGGNLQKVKAGIGNIMKAKRKFNSFFPLISVQFIVFKHNEHEVSEFKNWAKEIGVSYEIKSAQVYDFEHDTEFIPNNLEFSRYTKTENNSYQINSALENKCWKMWHSAVITWDGKVLPCCFDKDAKYVMGNVFENNFNQIWNNNNYTNFREKLLHSRFEIDICKNCTEGTKVFV